MARKELYTVRQLSPTTWEVLKCDKDFNPTGKYQISKPGTHYECTCFASNKSICRHRTMILEFEVENKINSHWWYEFDAGKKQPKWIEGPKNVV